MRVIYLFIGSLILLTLNAYTFSKPSKVKSSISRIYLYSAGEPNDEIYTETITKYNQSGFPIEEISDKLHKKTFNYLNDSLLLSSSEYDLNKNKLIYKKINTYTDNFLLSNVKIYSDLKANEFDGVELVAQMSLNYNQNNKISQKIYWGDIDVNGIELARGPYSSSSTKETRVNDRLKGIDTANYLRLGNGKIDCIVFKNNPSYIIKYKYNKDSQLISITDSTDLKKATSFRTLTNPYYFYYYDHNNKLIEKKISGLLTETIIKYNINGNVTERLFYHKTVKLGLQTELELQTKTLYFYENDLLIKEIVYDSIDEPNSVTIYEYDFY